MASDIIIFGRSLETWILVIVLIVAGVLIAQLAYALTRRWSRRVMSDGSARLFGRIFQYLILAVALYLAIVIVAQLNVTAFVASIGIVGLVVAFASQQIIQNFMAGVLLAIDKRAQIGDWIFVGGASEMGPSQVAEIDLTKTTLAEPDGTIHVVPNSMLISSRITNYTRSGFVWVAVPVSVPPHTDLTRVKEVAIDAAAAVDDILPGAAKKEPDAFKKVLAGSPRTSELFEQNKMSMSDLEPSVLITAITTLGLTLSVGIWVMHVEKRASIASDYLYILVNRLQAEGIIAT